VESALARSRRHCCTRTRLKLRARRARTAAAVTGVGNVCARAVGTRARTARRRLVARRAIGQRRRLARAGRRVARRRGALRRAAACYGVGKLCQAERRDVECQLVAAVAIAGACEQRTGYRRDKRRNGCVVDAELHNRRRPYDLIDVRRIEQCRRQRHLLYRCAVVDVRGDHVGRVLYVEENPRWRCEDERLASVHRETNVLVDRRGREGRRHCELVHVGRRRDRLRCRIVDRRAVDVHHTAGIGRSRPVRIEPDLLRKIWRQRRRIVKRGNLCHRKGADDALTGKAEVVLRAGVVVRVARRAVFEVNQCARRVRARALCLLALIRRRIARARCRRRRERAVGPTARAAVALLAQRCVDDAVATAIAIRRRVGGVCRVAAHDKRRVRRVAHRARVGKHATDAARDRVESAAGGARSVHAVRSVVVALLVRRIGVIVAARWTVVSNAYCRRDRTVGIHRYADGVVVRRNSNVNKRERKRAELAINETFEVSNISRSVVDALH